ncbi:hypothetical protein F4778DRAFT_538452 [Xylariomycetidae sp. FL2044]|nr:hypothetical protein F4778DRAFT_538452 [Xylariomycetidae sp. FL2044]
MAADFVRAPPLSLSLSLSPPSGVARMARPDTASTHADISRRTLPYSDLRQNGGDMHLSVESIFQCYKASCSHIMCVLADEQPLKEDLLSFSELMTILLTFITRSPRTNTRAVEFFLFVASNFSSFLASSLFFFFAQLPTDLGLFRFLSFHARGGRFASFRVS